MKITLNENYRNRSDLCGIYVNSQLLETPVSDILAVNVIGHEWFDKVNGNSYNDFAVEFSLKNGQVFTLLRGVIEYGYGDYYMQRARCALKFLRLADVPRFNSKQPGCLKRELYTVKDLDSDYSLLLELSSCGS
jgi:hypothetical protein